MNINQVLYDIRAIGLIIYTLICGDSPRAGRIVHNCEEDSVGYVSFANRIWKTISPNALKFVKRLIRPMQTSETFESLLLDSFILDNTNSAFPKIELPVENIQKSRKTQLHLLLASLVSAVKQRRQ